VIDLCCEVDGNISSRNLILSSAICENPDTVAIDTIAQFSKLKELDILLWTDSSTFEDRPIADYMIEKLPHVPRITAVRRGGFARTDLRTEWKRRRNQM
jgi:hypothetical protein